MLLGERLDGPGKRLQAAFFSSLLRDQWRFDPDAVGSGNVWALSRGASSSWAGCHTMGSPVGWRNARG